MTDELIGKNQFKRDKLRVKVTYELECDSLSGEVTYGNLVDVIDVKPVNTIENAAKKNSLTVIEEFIQGGNSLKKDQIEVLVLNNFDV